MNALQKKSPVAVGNHVREKLLQSFASLLPGLRQIICGIVSWTALLGMMGTIGGMDQGTISFSAGAVRAAICLVIWIISLRAGGWIK